MMQIINSFSGNFSILEVGKWIPTPVSSTKWVGLWYGMVIPIRNWTKLTGHRKHPEAGSGFPQGLRIQLPSLPSLRGYLFGP